MMTLVDKTQTLPTYWPEREILREKGQFWTPAWVAQAMIAYVSQEASEVFDPATGEGAFLRALQSVKYDTKFYGLDIDEQLLSNPIYHQNASIFVEKRDFLANPPPRKFPAIIGNPPYIRHHRLSDATKTQLKQLALQIMGFTLDGRAGYHIYFLLQALHLLADKGRLAFIMPADVCEGVSAHKLWAWITHHFCLEYVITFTPEAAPFPAVDTNAIIFCLKHEPPQTTFKWVKVSQTGKILQEFIEHGECSVSGIDATTRYLSEALQTGLSRPKLQGVTSRYTLADFATVMRGIATGANEFFFLTKTQIDFWGIPLHYFKRTVGRTRDITGSCLTTLDIERLDQTGRPTFLLSIEDSYETLPITVQNYIQQGIELGLPDRALIKLRRPWYKSEKREIPELLFAYLGRRSSRFIKNEAQVLPLHCLHCVYTRSKNPQHIEQLWQVLNHPDTLANLEYVSKSYGSGALKAEPQNLQKLAIPEYLVEQYHLIPHSRQPLLFNWK